MCDRPPLRVAVASVKLGRIQRGFERVCDDLFGILRDELDVTLYKAGGMPNSREKVPPLLDPITAVARSLPVVGLRGEYKEYKRECLAFGACLLPELLRNRFDIIHVIDPPLAQFLHYLKQVFRFRARLLFTDACVMPPQYYAQAIHVHQVAQVHFQRAVELGIPESRMTLIPLGIHTQRFAATAGRRELRKKYGVADSTFVVLVVSALRSHKRIDYIIEEFSRLGGDVLLWIDGSPEDRSIAELARNKLGPRCRITHVPTGEIPELYRLSDLFVHASLEEGFGLAVVEAISAGLMVLTHNSPHFEWLIHDRDCLLDMRQPGNLTGRLRELQTRRDDLSRRTEVRAASVRQRFDWKSLVPAYLDMYRKVAAPDSRWQATNGKHK